MKKLIKDTDFSVFARPILERVNLAGAALAEHLEADLSSLSPEYLKSYLERDWDTYQVARRFLLPTEIKILIYEQEHRYRPSLIN